MATAGLVAARLLGILATLPAQLVERSFSWRWKLCLTVVLVAILTPVVPASPTAETATLLGFAVVREALIGALLGTGVQGLLFGVRVAGQLVSQLAGLSMNSLLDGGSSSGVAAYTRFLDLVTMSVFFLLGGHRLVVGSLLSTFVTCPVGTAICDEAAVTRLAQLVTASMTLGLQSVMPILAALLVSNLVAGMLGRIMPQFHVLLLSSGLNSLLLMASVLLGVGTTVWALEGHLQPLVVQMVQLCGG